MTDATTTLADLRKAMQDWVRARDWSRYHTPRNLAASVSIEAAELLELFQWLTPEEAAARAGDPTFRERVGEEMADVLSYLVSLANAMDIDLAAAFADKVRKNSAKYPVGPLDGAKRAQRSTDR
jgi:NTP pyrophosphatase (non-canonical NTP hydrolase)